MLELSILALIVLAGIYWTALWLMGRHEDVLYGDFVSAGASAGLPPPPEPEPPPRLLAPEIPRRRRGALVPPDIFARPAAAGEPERKVVDTIEPPALTQAPRPPARPVLARPAPQPAAPAPRTPVGTGAEVGREPLIPKSDVASRERPSSIVAPPMTMRPPAFGAQPAASFRRSAPAQTDVLASLLETIKRDLGNTVGK